MEQLSTALTLQTSVHMVHLAASPASHAYQTASSPPSLPPQTPTAPWDYPHLPLSCLSRFLYSHLTVQTVRDPVPPFRPYTPGLAALPLLIPRGLHIPQRLEHRFHTQAFKCVLCQD